MISMRCSGGTAANTRPASIIGRMYRWNSVSSRQRMCAPSTSASAIRMTLPYRAGAMSKVRPEPAPTTWMIAAHSAFFSMSAMEAFCTLRILPRIGSSAWNSVLRANFAVPSAESPSTMNSSLRSTSSLRQSSSFAGSAELSSAFLRRRLSRCSRAAMRAFAAATIFSSTARSCCLAGPAWWWRTRPSAPGSPRGRRSGWRRRCRAPPWSGPRTAARAPGRSPRR